MQDAALRPRDLIHLRILINFLEAASGNRDKDVMIRVEARN